jgi:hypothetical protein
MVSYLSISYASAQNVATFSPPAQPLTVKAFLKPMLMILTA